MKLLLQVNPNPKSAIWLYKAYHYKRDKESKDWLDNFWNMERVAPSTTVGLSEIAKSFAAPKENKDMSKATEILDKHVIEFQDEFLDTAKRKALKVKILAAMEEYKEGNENIYEDSGTISGNPEVSEPNENDEVIYPEKK